MGFTVTENYLNHATFKEFRDALKALNPTGMTEVELDNAITMLWAHIMLSRFGVKL